MTMRPFVVWCCFLCIRLFSSVAVELLDTQKSGASHDNAIDEAQEVCADGGEVTAGSNNCRDFHPECPNWAEIGECQINPGYMMIYCRKSCGDVCSKEETEQDLALDLGVAQTTTTSFPQENERILKTIQDARHYMSETVYVDPEYASIANVCRNQHQDCARWASEGECDKNRGFMSLQCAPVCRTCLEWSLDHRCPLDPNAEDAFSRPGQVHDFFRRILNDYSQYRPKILSRPDDTAETDDYQVGPWVITMEDFLSEAEAERIIELGHIEGYQRSPGMGEMKADGSFEANISQSRTSSNAWCIREECFRDETAQIVMERISNLTQIPLANSEHLQLLKYEEGQYYETHHDYIRQERTRPQGVRIITVFMYLNEVEAGGGTNFPKLGLTVSPKRGRVLIWPSVLDEDPNEQDDRTFHQALPVVKGIKYAANAWIHQRDFKAAFDRNCH